MSGQKEKIKDVQFKKTAMKNFKIPMNPSEVKNFIGCVSQSL